MQRRHAIALKAVSLWTIVLAAMGLALFPAAGTWRYWNAWLWLSLMTFPPAGAFAYLLRKDPGLLEKRLRLGETDSAQKILSVLINLVLCASLVVAGLDRRFSLSEAPLSSVILASILVLAGMGLDLVVLLENRHASRTVRIQEGQRLIDSGMYGHVRHPMYLALTLVYLSAPLVLGSLYAFLVMLLFPLLMAIRILKEEKVLEEGLEGYREYEKRVKYRLFPFIW